MTIVLILFYLLSYYGAYKFMQKAHSKDGRWSSLDTGMIEIILILIPIVNTVFAFDYVTGFWKRYSNKESYNKFFRVKK